MIGHPIPTARTSEIARSREPTEEETELISAYLDGELSEAESARVERLLAERPDLAELLQQFREVDSDLRDRLRK
jgi:anti-sigma factor RsiW